VSANIEKKIALPHAAANLCTQKATSKNSRAIFHPADDFLPLLIAVFSQAPTDSPAIPHARDPRSDYVTRRRLFANHTTGLSNSRIKKYILCTQFIMIKPANKSGALSAQAESFKFLSCEIYSHLVFEIGSLLHRCRDAGEREKAAKLKALNHQRGGRKESRRKSAACRVKHTLGRMMNPKREKKKSLWIDTKSSKKKSRDIGNSISSLYDRH
jgi:hypothetical protein